MRVVYKCLLLSAFFFFTKTNAQTNFWSDVSESTLKTGTQKRLVVPNKFRSIVLDTLQLKQLLATAPMEFTNAANKNPLILELPTANGGTAKFAVVESPMMEPGLAAKFPNFKTYSGQGIDDRTATIKLDWTELGFHAFVRSSVSESFTIDPYALNNKTGYIIYTKKDLPVKPFKEHELEQAIETQTATQRTQTGFCFGQFSPVTLRTYRLAVAATGEYTAFFGGTVPNALAAIVNTVNRINSMYETEVAIRLILIANNNNIIFTNAATDPYNPTIGINGPEVDGVLLNQNQTAIDNFIGSSGYDIGHLVTTIDGGGIAQRPSVCIAGSKARGATGLANPSGDNYDVDFVAHEIGHQFGGDHSFNALTGNCVTRNAATAVEPGSGITIMAYAGICTSVNDLAAHSIPYFHTISQGQIGTYSNNNLGNTCATTIITSNNAPSVNAGADYTIPASTPFSLTGTATDANGDALTYSWEQIDIGVAGANWNSGSSPFFRSFLPKASGIRYFPQLSDVANGTTTIGEKLPSTAQTLNFRLTVRDNRNGGGGVCSDEMALVIAPSSGFAVSSQWGGDTWNANGTNTASIVWDIAGTNAAPINCAAVDILFSADGGLTFPYTLLTNTPNDGSQDIIIPAVATTKGRVMVKARNNVFFNVNTANINVINALCSAEGAIVTPAVAVSGTAGSSTLNLSLSPQYANAPFSASGTLTTSSSSTNLICTNASNTCQQYTNLYHYALHRFVVNVTGAYTFARTGSGSVFNFYANSFDPTNLCNNWLSSNFNGTSTFASVSVNLTAGVPYILVEGVFGANSTTPATTLPFAYSFSVTPPAGGAALNGSSLISYPNPGAGFSYSYVIVDNATNTIKAISSTANLTNTTTYPNGTSYTVYGISYNTSHTAALNSYVGTNLSALTSAMITNPSTFCANLSKNTVSVNVQAVVPVTFLGLKARKQDKKVLLEWATATELNSDYFAIQRSADGTNFTTELGKLTAAGTSNSIKNYTITDAQPLNGWGYYRIKQVDKDGHLSYSNIAAINFDKAGALVIVYPNPAKEKLTVEYTSTKAGTIQMQVIDSKGALILNNNATVTIGRNTNTLNVSSLSKGVYVLKCMDADNNTSFVKFIKE